MESPVQETRPQSMTDENTSTSFPVEGLAKLDLAITSCHLDVLRLPDKAPKGSLARQQGAPSTECSSPLRDVAGPMQHEALEHTADTVAAEATGGEDVSPSPSPAIKVVVLEPEKAEVTAVLGLKSQQWLYRIIVDSDLPPPGLVAKGVEVRRSFSDFEAMNRVLHAEYVGCFFPPLPQKAAFLEANTEEFLRNRRQDLQVFLRAIVAHPMLQHSEAMKIFLLQSGELCRNPSWLILSSCLLDAKRPGLTVGLDHVGDDSATAPHHVASSSGSATFGSFGSWVSRMKLSTATAFQQPHQALPAEESNLRQAKQLLQDLERLLELSTQSARALCLSMDKLAGDMRDFGYHCSMLTKYEEAVRAQVGSYSADGCSAVNRGADLQKLAICQAKQSVAWKTLATRCAANLVTLQDHYLLMPEAVQAMQEREAALEHVQLLEEELADRKQQLEQLREPGSAKGLMRAFSVGHSALSKHEKKSYQLSQSISVLEDELKTAIARYNIIKGRNQSELTRLGLQRESDFKRMMAAFAANHAKLVSASANIWASLADRFSSGSN